MRCPTCTNGFDADVQVCPADGTPLVFAAGDEIEARLVRALRAEPQDRVTRAVYADWLEQHGYETRASYLRIEASEPWDPAAVRAVATPVDASWRAITSRAPVARCAMQFAYTCERRWDDLAPTDTDGVRHCRACDKRVYFCTTIEEARRHGARRECITIDEAVAHGVATAAYDTGMGPRMPQPHTSGMVMGRPAYGPDPSESAIVDDPAPKPGLLSRIGRWFTRR